MRKRLLQGSAFFRLKKLSYFFFEISQPYKFLAVYYNEHFKTFRLMTKKEFKERSNIHVYVGRGVKLIALFFDWKNGYKYMLKSYSTTQKDILNDAYNILIKNNCDNLWNYDMRIADSDEERFKIPLSLS